MENEFIQWLQDRLPCPDHLKVPIGDDAAVLDIESGHQVVVAADALLEGIHFDLAEHSARQVGRKSLAVNLSDLAAMAAKPLSAVVTLALPRPADAAAELAREILNGIASLAEQFEMSISGGDTNCWDQRLTVSVSVMGVVPAGKVWTRSGGRVGDRLVVSGPLGGSILGHHLSFTPRVDDALRWSREFNIKAAMDVSDGLALDASRIAQASGCGIVLDLERLPISDAATKLSHSTGRTPLEHALGDGEDFELLLVMPPDEAARFCETQGPAKEIGALIESGGLWSASANGPQPLETLGFRHG